MVVSNLISSTCAEIHDIYHGKSWQHVMEFKEIFKLDMATLEQLYGRFRYAKGVRHQNMFVKNCLFAASSLEEKRCMFMDIEGQGSRCTATTWYYDKCW